MKIGMSFATGALVKSKHSHKGAWARIRADQLKHAGVELEMMFGTPPWDGYDRIYLYHGMEYKGGKYINMYGGSSDENSEFFQRILDYEGEIISLDLPMPDYGLVGRFRCGHRDATEKWKNIDWNAMSEKCSKIKQLKHPELTSHLVLGDSHSLSVYQHGDTILRMDGKTMHGISKMGIDSVISKEFGDHEFDSMTLYFGNIDVRHHLCRMPDPVLAANSLATRYENAIHNSQIANVEIVELLPIENESRGIPKSGWYDGAGFHGSWKDRTLIRNHLCRLLEEMANRNSWRYFKHQPEIWNAAGELDFACMERPKNVHKSPVYYRCNLFPDDVQDANISNQILVPERSDTFFSEFFS